MEQRKQARDRKAKMEAVTLARRKRQAEAFQRRRDAAAVVFQAARAARAAARAEALRAQQRTTTTSKRILDFAGGPFGPFGEEPADLDMKAFVVVAVDLTALGAHAEYRLQPVLSWFRRSDECRHAQDNSQGVSSVWLWSFVVSAGAAAAAGVTRGSDVGPRRDAAPPPPPSSPFPLRTLSPWARFDQDFAAIPTVATRGAPRGKANRDYRRLGGRAASRCCLAHPLHSASRIARCPGGGSGGRAEQHAPQPSIIATRGPQPRRRVRPPPRLGMPGCPSLSAFPWGAPRARLASGGRRPMARVHAHTQIYIHTHIYIHTTRHIHTYIYMYI